MSFPLNRLSPSASLELFVDTNILVLLVVGSVDPQLIAKCKRTQAFDVRDFGVLIRFIQQFRALKTTAPVITETCNLLENFNAERKQTMFAAIARLLQQMAERQVRCIELSNMPMFMSLGLADTSLLSGGKRGATILTDDLSLFLRLNASGVRVINFNHLRMATWAQSNS